LITLAMNIYFRRLWKIYSSNGF